MGVSLETWRKLYSRQDIEHLFEKIIKINYYQVYNTERGVQLRCFPSGQNNGSCFWELRNVQTHQKILMVNSIAQFSWRTCLSYDLERLKQSQQEEPYELVIFTKTALEAFAEGEEARIAETIKKINSNADQDISTTVVLDNSALCVDLVPRLAAKPEGPILSIILGHSSFHNFHNFTNSYVDYLSPHYKNQIYGEPPDYPLAHYPKLKSKGYLVIGSL
jgi:hypothetical protein